MRVIALAALVATTEAALGDDCFYDASICNAPQLYCATWEDSQYGDMASCEDCTDGAGQTIYDSFGDRVEYVCPPESYPGAEEPEDEEPAAGCYNDDSTGDRDGDTCTMWYDNNPHGCGNYDTDSFSALDQCCACGGGIIVEEEEPEEEAHPAPVEEEGFNILYAVGALIYAF